jgi:hypothetical protein
MFKFIWKDRLRIMRMILVCVFDILNICLILVQLDDNTELT